jgi:hypothetical protein
MDTPNFTTSANRRRFLGRMGGFAAATLAADAIGTPTLAGATVGAQGGRDREHPADHEDPDRQRADEAYRIRREAALAERRLPLPVKPTNGDEQRYASRIGSFSKTLPHSALGEVDGAAYQAMLNAIASGAFADFELIPAGGALRLANPQAAYAFDLEGADSHHLGLAVPPAFASARAAAEMCELYWQAITRDVPFADYESHPLTQMAAGSLSALSQFDGPQIGGAVTPATLFRGQTPGDLTGPYISQFLWKDVPYGSTPIVQKIRTAVTGIDFLNDVPSLLANQDGVAPAQAVPVDPSLRYIRNNRDLGEYVHRDFTYQAFLNAALILLGYGAPALDPANIYRAATRQSGFTTFGGPHLLSLVAHVANGALKATWYQKWLLHRRLRPEAFGALVHLRKIGAATYPVHPELLNASALPEVFAQRGGYLLPQAYPEGAPAHPSYPAGHAAIAGACATALKWFFDESFAIPSPVVASADGQVLEPYTGPTLTVGGELNKLAANIAIGRDAAGVHYRSDAIEGLRLGEAVCLSILVDERSCFSEPFNGLSVTTFDGAIHVT